MNENPEGKNKKKLILIIVGIFLLLVAIVVGLYFFLTQEKEPEKTDAELLVSVGTWEKEGSEKVKWIFKDGGKGTLTTNETNFYDFTWTLSDEANSEGEKVLKIDTNWFYTMKDEFSFVYNREENTFHVVSSEDGKESTFIPTTGNSSNSSGEDEPSDVVEENEE